MLWNMLENMQRIRNEIYQKKCMKQIENTYNNCQYAKNKTPYEINRHYISYSVQITMGMKTK